MLKLLLLFGTFWLVYKQVFANENFEQIKITFSNQLESSKLIFLVVSVCMVILNWWLESKKWQLLTKEIEKLSNVRALKSVLIGLSLSVFTPARIGEFGGRALFFENKNKIKSVLATFLGGISQMIIVVSFGLLGLMYFLVNHFTIRIFVQNSLLVLGLLVLILLFFFYYNVSTVLPVLRKIKLFKKHSIHFEFLQSLERKLLSKVLVITFIRYSVFSFQYIFLLIFFGVNINVLQGLAGTSSIFIVQTGLPLPAIWDIFLRGEIALQIWNVFGANQISILAATFSLWFINLLVPSFIGMILMMNMNLSKAFGVKQLLK